MGNVQRLEGAHFESDLEFQCRLQKILFIKMPLGCRRIGGFRKIIQVPTPFDYTLIKDGISVFLDCKTYDKSKVSHSMLVSHQVQALESIYENGCNAGYLVHMRNLSKVFFFIAPKLWLLQPRTSLSPEEGLCLGNYESFDLNKLFANPLKTLA